MTTTTTPAPIAHTTRRNLLIAAPAVVTIAALPAFAMAKTGSADRSGWNAAKATYDRVNATDAAFVEGYMALWERCKAACEQSRAWPCALFRTPGTINSHHRRHVVCSHGPP